MKNEHCSSHPRVFVRETRFQPISSLHLYSPLGSKLAILRVVKSFDHFMPLTQFTRDATN
jgi:hypothetical protein